MKRRFSAVDQPVGNTMAVDILSTTSDMPDAPPIPTTPPPLQGPTAKEKKYDRQLRLWAASGQAALEESQLLLINSGPGVVGVEALKNLVLPGIGHFTIVDPEVVTEKDLGVNFFLDEGSLGHSRAEQTCKMLQELNPDVSGHFIAESITELLKVADVLKPYSIILVASPLDSNVLKQIMDYGRATSVPVFYIHSVGFYAHFSILVPNAFPIVDTHPDPASTADLRLIRPWPALLEYARKKTEALDLMEDHIHGHVPYLLLILYYLEKWQANHDGKLPSNYKEKNEFKKLLNAGMRMNNAEGGEENYEQGVAAVLKNLNEPTPNSAVREVFDSQECTHLTSESANFWIIAHAISQFYQTEGVLPLPGSVPDMKAISSDYIELQNVYKSKARQDVETVTHIVRTIEQQIGKPASIPQQEIDAFCKGAAHIKLIRGKKFPIAMKLASDIQWGDRAKSAAISLTDETSGILLYIAFLAYDSLFQQTSIPPGTSTVATDEAIEKDTAKMEVIANEIISGLLTQAGTTETPDLASAKSTLASYCHELARAGGGELHNISSLAGGLVAQEVIKVITKQYIPVDNTCIFDGIKSVAYTFKV